MADKSKEVKSILEPIISIIKSKPEARAIVNKWINGKYGKIIGWKMKSTDQEENYHLIFTSDDVRLNVGEYPAFDVMMIADSERILSILKGEKSINSELKTKNFMVWGNLNEGIIFEKILQKIKEL